MQPIPINIVRFSPLRSAFVAGIRNLYRHRQHLAPQAPPNRLAPQAETRTAGGKLLPAARCLPLPQLPAPPVAAACGDPVPVLSGFAAAFLLFGDPAVELPVADGLPAAAAPGAELPDAALDPASDFFIDPVPASGLAAVLAALVVDLLPGPAPLPDPLTGVVAALAPVCAAGPVAGIIGPPGLNGSGLPPPAAAADGAVFGFGLTIGGALFSATIFTAWGSSRSFTNSWPLAGCGT